MTTITKRFKSAGLTLALSFILALGWSVPLRGIGAQQSGNAQPLVSLSGVTTGTGVVISVGNSVQVGWTVIWSAGVGAGEIVIEAADTVNYSGTWYELDRQPFAVNATIMGTYPGPVRFVRARVTTTVTGGTVTAQFNRLIGS